MKRTCLFVFLLSLITLNACQRVKDKGRELVDKSVAKVKQKGDAALKSTVVAVARNLTTTQKTTFLACFGGHNGLSVQEIDGLLVDIPPGFYERFLTYKADRKAVLQFIEALPTQKREFTEKHCTRTDGRELYERLTFYEENFPNVKEQVPFFYQLRQEQSLDHYRYMKYPFVHHLAFNTKTGMVYHFSGEFWN